MKQIILEYLDRYNSNIVNSNEIHCSLNDCFRLSRNGKLTPFKIYKSDKKEIENFLEKTGKKFIIEIPDELYDPKAEGIDSIFKIKNFLSEKLQLDTVYINIFMYPYGKSFEESKNLPKDEIFNIMDNYHLFNFVMETDNFYYLYYEIVLEVPKITLNVEFLFEDFEDYFQTGEINYLRFMGDHSENSEDIYEEIVRKKLDKNIENISLTLPVTASIFNVKNFLAQNEKFKLEKYFKNYNICDEYIRKMSYVKNVNILNIKDKVPYDDEQHLFNVHMDYLNFRDRELTSKNELSSLKLNTFFSLDVKENYNSLGKNNFQLENFDLKVFYRMKKCFKLHKKYEPFLFYKYMEENIKVKFSENAPTYREASDGINLLIYCQNYKCYIFREMFIEKLGKEIFIFFSLYFFLRFFLYIFFSLDFFYWEILYLL